MKKYTIYSIVGWACVIIGTGVVVFGTRAHDNIIDTLSEGEIETITPIPTLWEESDTLVLPHMDIENAWKGTIETLFGKEYIIVSGEGMASFPFVFGSPETLVSHEHLYLHEWISDDAFTFTIYNPDACDFFSCEGDRYVYSLSRKAYTPLSEESGIVSPSGRYEIVYETDEESDDFGLWLIEDRVLGVQHNLGTALYMTGAQGKYVRASLFSIVWSPDEDMIAMLDASDWNEGGPAVYVLSRMASSIDEREYVGRVRYKEIARPSEPLIFWSADSAYMIAGDSDTLFDMRSRKEIAIHGAYPRFWSWSPSEQRFLSVATSYGCSIVDVNKKTAFGYVFMDTIDDVAGIVRDATLWNPEGKYILVTTDHGVYGIDADTHAFGKIHDETFAGTERMIWSPNGTHLVSLQNGAISVREVIR